MLTNEAKNQFEKRINLGCGHDYKEGYINIDFNSSHKVDIVSDVTWLKPLEDKTAIEIIAQDVLEHISRDQCQTALREWNRIMMIDGKLTIRVPSLIHLLNLFNRRDFQPFEKQETLIQNLFGTQHYNGDFHLNGFTKITLKSHLERAGFKVIEIKTVDEWMLEATSIKVHHYPPDKILRIEDDETFINHAFISILKRQADPEGLQYYLDLIQKDKIPRESVLKNLQASDEYNRINIVNSF